MKAFANGGEHHVAQIAPAGAWRVWAEEETGGEAYIPLSAAKRARSLAIMHDVAARFGHVMVPVHAQRFADGSSGMAPTPRSTAPARNYPDINVSGYGAHEVAALVVTRVRDAVDNESVQLAGG